jgi:hypothetical protein
MMTPVGKLSHLLFAAACVRDILDEDGTKGGRVQRAGARVHLGITDLMRRIKTGHGIA